MQSDHASVPAFVLLFALHNGPVLTRTLLHFGFAIVMLEDAKTLLWGTCG